METFTYKSKIDWWVVFIPIFILGAEVAVFFVDKGMWPGIITLVILSVFVLPIFVRTSYTITNNNVLIVRCGFILIYRIEVNKIYLIRSSWSYETSPALSFDRIAIYYHEGNDHNYVLISPNDKMGFINTLKERNTTINVAL